jgi:hypothetical protein
MALIEIISDENLFVSGNPRKVVTYGVRRKSCVGI